MNPTQQLPIFRIDIFFSSERHTNRSRPRPQIKTRSRSLELILDAPSRGCDCHISHLLTPPDAPRQPSNPQLRDGKRRYPRLIAPATSVLPTSKRVYCKKPGTLDRLHCEFAFPVGVCFRGIHRFHFPRTAWEPFLSKSRSIIIACNIHPALISSPFGFSLTPYDTAHPLLASRLSSVRSALFLFQTKSP